MSAAVGGWRTDLPRLVLLLQVGNAGNFFGYGLILPFEIIYVHQIRGFPTATAGFVLGTILGTATLVTPPTGALLDHFRPKPILIVGNLARRSAMPALRSSTGHGRRSPARPSAVPASAVVHEIEPRLACGFGPTDQLTPLHCCLTALQLLTVGVSARFIITAGSSCEFRSEDQDLAFREAA
jgi:hypothetical protein